jgi:6-phosphofructokinase 1
MNNKIKRIGIFTSGGDAPGMNAAIRAVTRAASYHDLHVFGIYRGYEGMIDGEIKRMETSDVANILQRGGTILKTSRSERFLTTEGRKAAYDNLVAQDIDALVALGGDGTFRGADAFYNEYSLPIIGLPCTIDNDLSGTDFTIGFFTAVDTAVEAVDKIRDTADSHNRVFFIEVMGRNSGYIALYTAVASGASAVLIPEIDSSLEELIENINRSLKRKKLFGLVIIAEGNKLGSTEEIAREIKDRIKDYDIRVSIFGHIQRGGSPCAYDRMLASRLGYASIEGLLNGKTNSMTGIINDQVHYTSFEETVSTKKNPEKELIRMAEILGL